jgi:hypothetical protein
VLIFKEKIIITKRDIIRCWRLSKSADMMMFINDGFFQESSSVGLLLVRIIKISEELVGLSSLAGRPNCEQDLRPRHTGKSTFNNPTEISPTR